MKKLLFVLLTTISFSGFAQMGEVWPTLTRQEFDIDDEFNITKEYESKSYCSFFMFIDNNEFFHTTDGITSLYKILKRDEQPTKHTYTVASEVGNIYTYVFDKTNKEVLILSSKGYGIYFKCLPYYETKVFENVDK